MDATEQHIRPWQGKSKDAGEQRQYQHYRVCRIHPKHERTSGHERHGNDQRNASNRWTPAPEPSRMLTERCRRLASAARMAAMDSGVSTSNAMMKPLSAKGAPSLMTIASSGAANCLANKTSGRP